MLDFMAAEDLLSLELSKLAEKRMDNRLAYTPYMMVFRTSNVSSLS